MKDVELVEINGTSYAVLKEVKHNDTSYLYLSNINDEEDMMIRKASSDDMLIPLESEEEFELACNLLIKEGLI